MSLFYGLVGVTYLVLSGYCLKHGSSLKRKYNDYVTANRYLLSPLVMASVFIAFEALSQWR